MLEFGAAGRVFALRLLGRRAGPVWQPPRWSPARTVTAVIVVGVLGALWWLAAGQWLLDALTRTGGILIDKPHVLG
jgi:hypothetical protein